MLEDILNLIENKEYTEAEKQLLQVIKGDDECTIAFANAVLGELYQRYDFKNNDELALRYLRRNIFSKYPHPHAYYIYAQLEKDKNIVENNLRQGLARFPDDVRLWQKLFLMTGDKNRVIAELEEKKINNLHLFKEILLHYMEAQKWDKAISYVTQINAMKAATVRDKMFATLFEGFSYLFCNVPDYAKSQMLFAKITVWDRAGAFKYSNYLGTCFSLIKQGKRSEAEIIFDRIPTNNSICDFIDGPWYDDYFFDFEKIYRVIFRTMTDFFSDDLVRKEKANVLLSLYLYSPSQDYGLFRYKKSDAAVLTRYLKKVYSKDIAIALYNMRCHFNQFGEAYDAIWELIKHYDDIEASDISFSDAIESASDAELSELCVRVEQHLSDEDYDIAAFISQIFESLIEELHNRKMYPYIVQISKKLTDKDIIESNCAFECAYAFKNCKNIRAQIIYTGLVKKEPKNSSAINNLGVILEESGDLMSAYQYYCTASTLNPNDSICSNNVDRIKNQIKSEEDRKINTLKKQLSVDSLDKIGYSVELCAKVRSIANNDMQDILLRDLRECAISVITNQDKSAAILCGSITEALLIMKMTGRGVDKYDISEISKSKHATNYPLQDMALNELLFVASKEKIITSNTFHLGHYIRDYRNIVHPAKEMKMAENITHDNVVTMWNVLKQIIEDILQNTACHPQQLLSIS